MTKDEIAKACEDMLRTAEEYRGNPNRSCREVEMAIYWEAKAAALRARSTPDGQ
jgi:hypothetical protein